MSATPALSARPANALPIWTDGRSLYTELPGPDSRPVIIRYPLTTSGLSSALGLIRSRTYDYSGHAHIPHEPTNQPGTPAQRDNARAILRRMGLLG